MEIGEYWWKLLLRPAEILVWSNFWFPKSYISPFLKILILFFSYFFTWVCWKACVSVTMSCLPLWALAATVGPSSWAISEYSNTCGQTAVTTLLFLDICTWWQTLDLQEDSRAEPHFLKPSWACLFSIHHWHLFIVWNIKCFAFCVGCRLLVVIDSSKTTRDS